MIKSCHNCKHSRENNRRNEWCIYSMEGECNEHGKKWELYRNDYRQGTTPSSTDDCETRYPDTNDIPEGTCERCGLNTIGGSCGHRPKKKESIIIVGSRYYQPPQDEGQIEQIVPFPVLVDE